jgi:hypothetical protein
MKMTLTTYDIAHELMQDRTAGWTRAGAFALAEHLEEYEDSTGEELELDVVALRCDFSEYSDLIEWADDYFGTAEQCRDALGLDDDEQPEDAEDKIRDYIQENGQLIEFKGGIIVSSF